jgi:hypothetical protein
MERVMDEQELMLRGIVSMLSPEKQKAVSCLRDELLAHVRATLEEHGGVGFIAVSLASVGMVELMQESANRDGAGKEISELIKKVK